MKYLYTFILTLAITLGYSQTTLLSHTFDSDAEGWGSVGAAATGADGLFAYEATAGNPDGSISFGGFNSEDKTAGQAYETQFATGANTDFGTATYLEVTFDLKLKQALNQTAVHFALEVGGISRQNTFDLQNDGLNDTTWTSYTIGYDGVNSNATGVLLLNFNLAASAANTAGGELLLDNVIVKGYDSNPNTSLKVSVDVSQYLNGQSGLNIFTPYGNSDWTEIPAVNEGNGIFSYTFSNVPADTNIEYLWKAYHSPDQHAAHGTDKQENLIATIAAGGADNLTAKLYPNATFNGAIVNEGLNSDYSTYANRIIKSNGVSYTAPTFIFGTFRKNNVDYSEITLDSGATTGGGTAAIFTSLDWNLPSAGGVDNGDGTYTAYADPSQVFEYFWKLDDTAELLINCTADDTIVNTDGLNYANRIHGAGEDRSDEFNTCPPGTLSIIDNELGIIEIYPNPFVDRISVNTEEAIDVVRIYDLTGRMVQQATPNKANFSLNVADLSKGVYLVKLNAGNKEATTKLIK